MTNTPKTFDAYVMFCGAEEVPDQSRLTRAGCLGVIAEICENYEVDLILHITSEDALKGFKVEDVTEELFDICLLYTSPSPRDATLSRMPSSA